MDIAVGEQRGMWQRESADAYLSETLAPGVVLVAVADGFGTIVRGVPVAKSGLLLLRDFLRRKARAGTLTARNASPATQRQTMLAAFSFVNARLYTQSGSHEDYVASGTSMTALLLVGDDAFIGHVGATRAYLLRHEMLASLTEDDAVILDVPRTTKSVIPAEPATRSLLTRTLGTQAALEASTLHVELLGSDRVALCTDGVHRCVDVEDLRAALAMPDTPSDTVGRILASVRAYGGLDGGTVIVGRDLTSGPHGEDAAEGCQQPHAVRIAAIMAIILVLTTTLGLWVVHMLW